MKRRLVVPAALAWLIFCVPLAQAGQLDACAQRVIRDWYSGGRVDELYPLGCYRAAIRALPNDVLEYSDADKDIARALAFARRAKTDDGRRAPDPVETAPSSPTASEAVTPVTGRPSRSTDASAPRHASPSASTTPDRAPVRVVDEPRRVAAGPEPVEVSAAVPYPVIVLAALAGTLLAMGAAGWLLRRRH